MSSIAFATFNKDALFHKQINSKFPDHDPIVPNGHRVLLRDGKPSLAQLMHQRPFIHLLHEPSSQPMEHRLRAPNDSSGQQVNPALGAICPRVQRVLWFHFPFLTAGTTFRIR